MDIENVKAVIEAVRNRMKADYSYYTSVGNIVDETCNTIIIQLETMDSINKGQSRSYQAVNERMYE